MIHLITSNKSIKNSNLLCSLGVLCSRRHFWEEINGCYVSPSYEFEGALLVVIPPTDLDNVKFCREKCLLQQARYFLLKDGTEKCYCIITDNAPKGGFVNEEQCNRDDCAADQNPDDDNCHAIDGYVRARIYKTYSLTCPAFEADFTTKFYFPWDFHGNFHVGSKATLKCLPGYVLPKMYKSRKKRQQVGIFVQNQCPQGEVGDWPNCYKLPEFDYEANTQTIECIYDPYIGGKWNPDTIGIHTQ